MEEWLAVKKMLKKIKLKDQEIIIDLKSNPLAKRIRIIIHQNGKVVLTKPKRVSAKLALKFFESQGEFILQRLKEIEEKNKSLYGPNNDLAFSCELQAKQDYQRHKKKASIFIKERLEYFNQFYNFDFKKVSVRNQSTRWGSCSRVGNLNFNYRLLFLPRELADYVLVHELCHLKELNHSSDFWDLVGKKIPDYRQRRRQLKGYL